tara:strand:- start:5717 stop:5881 length:165 start_codon:yes stop_codon:yes gene_type:complete
MSTGKYTSLEEAKDDPKNLKRFIKEHPSKGNEKQFDDLLGRMANSKKKPANKTS